MANLILLLVLVLIGVIYADTPEDDDSSFVGYIQSPAIIQSDKITNITVYADDDIRLSLFDNYRLYLAIDPIYQNGSGLDTKYWNIGACYLVNSSVLATHNVSIQIPASVGVGGPQLSYAIVAIPFAQNISAPANQSNAYEDLIYGDKFSLSGGTAEWSQWELDGGVIGYPLYLPQDYLPCRAYDCARRCYTKYYPANLNMADDCGLKLSYECAAACPGATFPSFEVAVDGLRNVTDRPAQDLPVSCNATAYMTVTTSSTSGLAQPSSTTTASHSSASGAMVWKDIFGLVVASMLALAVM
jgi:hypothetical protein